MSVSHSQQRKKKRADLKNQGGFECHSLGIFQSLPVKTRNKNHFTHIFRLAMLCLSLTSGASSESRERRHQYFTCLKLEVFEVTCVQKCLLPPTDCSSAVDTFITRNVYLKVNEQITPEMYF